MHDRDHDYEAQDGPDALESAAEQPQEVADDSGPDGQMSSAEALVDQEEEQQIP